MTLETHYRENFDNLSKKAGHILNDFALGEDCVNEAYENMLKYATHLPAHEFSPYFTKVFSNCILKYADFLRTKGIVYEMPHEEPPPYRPVTGLELVTILQQIEASPAQEKMKKCLVLYYESGYNTEQCAIFHGTTPNAVRSGIKRFKKRLAKLGGLT